MIDITTEWDKQELQFLLNRIKQVEKDVIHYVISPAELPRLLSIAYVDLVRDFIIKGMLPMGVPAYAPYNKAYKIWKQKYGKYGGFWLLMGDLYASIKSFPFQNGYYGGVAFGSKSRDKSKPIVMYARVMEEGIPVSIRGSGVHPKRPLFGPILRQFIYSKSKTTRGNAWTIAEGVLKIIGKHWEGKP